MVNSIAACVKIIINKTPFINEMLIQDVISYSNLSKSIHNKVETMYGHPVNESAIVMAVRRYADDLRKSEKKQKKRKRKKGSASRTIPSWRSLRIRKRMLLLKSAETKMK